MGDLGALIVFIVMVLFVLAISTIPFWPDAFKYFSKEWSNYVQGNKDKAEIVRLQERARVLATRIRPADSENERALQDIRVTLKILENNNTSSQVESLIAELRNLERELSSLNVDYEKVRDLLEIPKDKWTLTDCRWILTAYDAYREKVVEIKLKISQLKGDTEAVSRILTGENAPKLLP